MPSLMVVDLSRLARRVCTILTEEVAGLVSDHRNYSRVRISLAFPGMKKANY